MSVHKFRINPKQVIVQPSSIEGAGLGLFLVEPVKEGERLAVYSGKELSKDQVRLSESEYIVRISDNVYLDGNSKQERGKGKFINCGGKSKMTTNAELGSGFVYNYNTKWDMKWISVFSTCNISASPEHPVEVLVDYGKAYWTGTRKFI